METKGSVPLLSFSSYGVSLSSPPEEFLLASFPFVFGPNLKRTMKTSQLLLLKEFLFVFQTKLSNWFDDRLMGCNHFSRFCHWAKKKDKLVLFI